MAGSSRQRTLHKNTVLRNAGTELEKEDGGIKMNNCKAILSNAGVGIRKRGKYNTRLKWRKNGYEAVISNEYLEQPTRLKAFIEMHNTVIEFLKSVK